MCSRVVDSASLTLLRHGGMWIPPPLPHLLLPLLLIVVVSSFLSSSSLLLSSHHLPLLDLISCYIKDLSPSGIELATWGISVKCFTTKPWRLWASESLEVSMTLSLYLVLGDVKDVTLMGSMEADIELLD